MRSGVPSSPLTTRWSSQTFSASVLPMGPPFLRKSSMLNVSDSICLVYFEPRGECRVRREPCAGWSMAVVACRSPWCVPQDPGRCFDLGCSLSHADLPAGGVDGSVVEPAQENTVAGVGRSALGIRYDVVDFAPAGGNLAAGDEASAVAQGDGLALVGCEAALG